MSIFNRKQQTEAKARSKRAWPFRLLALMTILMGMLFASPQVEAAEPKSNSGPSLSIQEVDDDYYVVEGGIFVNAEVGFKVPADFAGYKWDEIKRVALSSKGSSPSNQKIAPQQEAILYKISPTPQTLTEYDRLTRLLQGENSEEVDCAGVDHVTGSPNTRAGGFSGGSDPKPVSANFFEGQWAFNQFRSFRSQDDGQHVEVEVAVFDGFREDAKEWWQVNEVDFEAITVTPIYLISEPAHPDMPKHGEMIISQIHYLAPAATILPVHVLNDKLLGDTMTLIEGLDKVIERKNSNPDRKMVVNMSLGVKASPQNESCDIQTMNDLLNKAEEQGIVVVAAAGNDANTRSLTVVIAPPEDEIGELPRSVRPGPQYPANVNTVIGVAANNSDGQLTYYSNQGEVMIAGGEIRHCDGNSNCLKTHGIIGKIPTDSGNQSITWEGIAWEGTSFAAPLVSGLAAKMLSCNPDLRADEVRDFIDANPNSTNDPINVQNALASAGCLSDSPPPLDVSLICTTGPGRRTFCDATASGGSGNNQFTWQAHGGAIIVNASGSQATVNLGSCRGNPSVLVQVTDSSGNTDTDQKSLPCNPRGIGGPSPIPSPIPRHIP